MNGTMAVITCFAADFAPRYWTTCDGQTLSIAANQALYALIGNTYGGNPSSTFNLPDLRGRTPISAGQGLNEPSYNLGQTAGGETSQLAISNLPVHTHTAAVTMALQANDDDGIDPTANGGYPSLFTGAYGTVADSNMLVPAYTTSIGIAGEGQPFNILAPYVVINYIICLSGIFPSRN